MCYHVDRQFAGTEDRSLSSRTVKDLPIKKCAGDSTFGSEDMVEIGLQFKIPSTSLLR